MGKRRSEKKGRVYSAERRVRGKDVGLIVAVTSRPENSQPGSPLGSEHSENTHTAAFPDPDLPSVWSDGASLSTETGAFSRCPACCR